MRYQKCIFKVTKNVPCILSNINCLHMFTGGMNNIYWSISLLHLQKKSSQSHSWKIGKSKYVLAWPMNAKRIQHWTVQQRPATRPDSAKEPDLTKHNPNSDRTQWSPMGWKPDLPDQLSPAPFEVLFHQAQPKHEWAHWLSSTLKMSVCRPSSEVWHNPQKITWHTWRPERQYLQWRPARVGSSHAD